ncbi:hypothetical protein DPSP01_005636 [Paraphaeosphaeria sporulosa]|uniref:Uncharacterized protein n=1 Tax=Paraphaeosphaeria sporulosa TaxID=1460663 RepID=A0A177CT99_9PLEO|nr:uncharacterized protein CC84DRAFT_1112697 [Paraphaeosphaeria sporulosa]OAG10421.1 hypothetical protein CC84DRAFT_1112697 [Paraphaeosphaeria sporulosa]
MAATDTELARELSAIINSPCPVSLIKLAGILSSTDALTVRACIRQQFPCAVAKLASSLYDALPVWQCCVNILESLAQSLEFKNELLSRNPGLLDALLKKANTSQQSFEQYLGLCLQLLADPLPEAVPLPASVQSFFLRVLDQTSRKPNVQNLKPIYYMLKGACRGFLSLLTFDEKQLFDEQLCHILKSKVAPENFMLLLWCFGIAILAEHPELLDNKPGAHEGLRDGTVNKDLSVEWVTAAGRKLFESPHACKKTINLACLSVIWAIRDGSSVPDDEAVQGIRIATRALQLVDQRTLEHWATADMNSINTISKLWEKIQRCEVKPTVQREALCFYAVVGGPNKLSPVVVETYEAALVNLKGWSTMETQTSLSFSLPLFADRMQQASVQSLLSQLLEINHSPASVEQVQNATVLVNEIAAIASRHASFRSHIITALSDPRVQARIEAFLACCTRTHEEHQASFCPSHSSIVHRRFISATISMLLTTIVAAEPEQSPRIPLRLATALVEKQGQLSLPAIQCTHTPRQLAPTVSLFEQECTPISGLPLQDWRSRLKHELENQASYQQDSLIRAVAQICQDLENRCDNVEGPLRSEREKIKALTEELRQAQACVESLEQKRMDDNLFLGTLDAEKARLEKDNDELSSRLEDLRIQLEKSNYQAHTALHEAEEAYNYKEMHLRSVILQHEETIENYQKEIPTLREKTVALSDKLAKDEAARSELVGQYNDLQNRFEKEKDIVEDQRQDHVRLEDHCNNLQARLREAERELNEGKQAAVEKKEELVRITQKVTILESDLQQTRTNLAMTIERLEDLQIRHHELAQSSTKALQEVEAQCESDLEAAASKAAEEYHRLHEAYDDTRQEFERVQASIPPLQLQIQELSQECLTKENELEGLRAWQIRVFTSMGLPAPEPTPARCISKATYQHVDDMQPGLTQGITNTALDPLSDASFLSSSQVSRDGSTPKRSKSRHTSTDLSAQVSYNNPCMTSKTIKRPQAKRSALRPISPNRRLTTVGVSVTERKDEAGRQNLPLRKRRGSSRGSGEEDFEMSFAAGTPFTPGKFAAGTGTWRQEDGSITEL